MRPPDSRTPPKCTADRALSDGVNGTSQECDFKNLDFDRPKRQRNREIERQDASGELQEDVKPLKLACLFTRGVLQENPGSPRSSQEVPGEAQE